MVAGYFECGPNAWITEFAYHWLLVTHIIFPRPGSQRGRLAYDFLGRDTESAVTRSGLRCLRTQARAIETLTVGGGFVAFSSSGSNC